MSFGSPAYATSHNIAQSHSQVTPLLLVCLSYAHLVAIAGIGQVVHQRKGGLHCRLSGEQGVGEGLVLHLCVAARWWRACRGCAHNKPTWEWQVNLGTLRTVLAERVIATTTAATPTVHWGCQTRDCTCDSTCRMQGIKMSVHRQLKKAGTAYCTRERGNLQGISPCRRKLVDNKRRVCDLDVGAPPAIYARKDANGKVRALLRAGK